MPSRSTSQSISCSKPRRHGLNRNEHRSRNDATADRDECRWNYIAVNDQVAGSNPAGSTIPRTCCADLWARSSEGRAGSFIATCRHDLRLRQCRQNRKNNEVNDVTAGRDECRWNYIGNVGSNPAGPGRLAFLARKGFIPFVVTVSGCTIGGNEKAIGFMLRNLRRKTVPLSSWPGLTR
jgi:hypothetical protein